MVGDRNSGWAQRGWVCRLTPLNKTWHPASSEGRRGEGPSGRGGGGGGDKCGEIFIKSVFAWMFLEISWGAVAPSRSLHLLKIQHWFFTFFLFFFSLKSMLLSSPPSVIIREGHLRKWGWKMEAVDGTEKEKKMRLYAGTWLRKRGEDELFAENEEENRWEEGLRTCRRTWLVIIPGVCVLWWKWSKVGTSADKRFSCLSLNTLLFFLEGAFLHAFSTEYV